MRDQLDRFRIVEKQQLDGVTKYVGEFEFRHVQGTRLTAQGKVLLPDGASTPLPLSFQAGYEVPDAGAAAIAKQGFVVVNPVQPEMGTMWPGENPLTRSVNFDVALLHIARSLDVVDDARVMITGGSAGGWMALMVSAETFPLAGVIAQVPVFNWGYNAAFMLHNQPLGGVPAVQGGYGLAQHGVALLGAEPSSPEWFAHSPAAHVDEITAPVHMACTTADVLVPIAQISRELVRPADEGLPEGFTCIPEDVGCGELGCIRLTDVVADLEMHVLPLPDGAEMLDMSRLAEMKYIAMDLPAGERRWTVCVVDEGGQGPNVAHSKYAISMPRQRFLERICKWEPDPAQATEAKLRMLAKRYAGQEWIDTTIPHLDDPEAERADVERAMRTFRAMPGAREALEKLPADLLASLPAS